MDDPAQAEAYAGADFAEVNRLFVELLLPELVGNGARTALDLGCGPADIPVRLAAAVPGLTIVAVDGSAPMLALARRRLGSTDERCRVHLVRARIPSLPFSDRTFDAVVSNSLVHHLAEPRRFWAECLRLVRPGGLIHVMDLLRPATAEVAFALVEELAGREDPLLKRDFFRSLCAAYTLEEIQDQLPSALRSLGCRKVTDRHWLVSGRVHPARS
jgi:ubiquinone/menaquinone biosynthesis C-methylase UbiE